MHENSSVREAASDCFFSLEKFFEKVNMPHAYFIHVFRQMHKLHKMYLHENAGIEKCRKKFEGMTRFADST